MLPLSGIAQMRFTPNGNLYLGDFTDTEVNQKEALGRKYTYVNLYNGLQWVNADSEAQSMLMVDMTGSSPNVYGFFFNGAFDYGLDFCRRTYVSSTDYYTQWNTILNKIVYFQNSGTASGSIVQPLFSVSALRKSLSASSTPLLKTAMVTDDVASMVSPQDSCLDFGGMLSLLSGGMQQLQGKILSQQNEVNALLAEGTLQMVSKAIPQGQALTMDSPKALQTKKEGLIILSTLDGNIVRKTKVSAKDAGKAKVPTKDIEPGTYICTLIADGEIVSTHYTVITE